MSYEELEIIVQWQVDDGYVGNRPQKTRIKPNEHMDEEEWNELSESEKQEFIQDCVQEDFEQKISFGIDNYGI